MLADMAIAVEGSPALVYAAPRMIDSGAKNIAKVVLKARLPILSHVSLHLEPEIQHGVTSWTGDCRTD